MKVAKNSVSKLTTINIVKQIFKNKNRTFLDINSNNIIIKKASKNNGEKVEEKVVQRLLKEIDQRGALDVIRNGFTDLGVKFKMAYFRPESSLNPDAEEFYQKNHLSVTRQLYYERNGRNSLDMVLSLNGLPIATIELKNQFSGQDVNNAKKQYVYDREPNEPIFQFKKRAIVHFAIDADECYMTTS